jgi:hypothetical protein
MSGDTVFCALPSVRCRAGETIVGFLRREPWSQIPTPLEVAVMKVSETAWPNSNPHHTQPRRAKAIRRSRMKCPSRRTDGSGLEPLEDDDRPRAAWRRRGACRMIARLGASRTFDAIAVLSPTQRNPGHLTQPGHGVRRFASGFGTTQVLAAFWSACSPCWQRTARGAFAPESS